jgi:hypothetical protein
VQRTHETGLRGEATGLGGERLVLQIEQRLADNRACGAVGDLEPTGTNSERGDTLVVDEQMAVLARSGGAGRGGRRTAGLTRINDEVDALADRQLAKKLARGPRERRVGLRGLRNGECGTTKTRS